MDSDYIDDGYDSGNDVGNRGDADEADDTALVIRTPATALAIAPFVWQWNVVVPVSCWVRLFGSGMS